MDHVHTQTCSRSARRVQVSSLPAFFLVEDREIRRNYQIPLGVVAYFGAHIRWRWGP